jgi:hypothetical protein
MKYPEFTMSDWRAARKEYGESEPRALFYKAGTALVKIVRRGDTDLTMAEALSVLLQTWNVSFYRFRPEKLESLVRDLQGLLNEHQRDLDDFKERSIDDLGVGDERTIVGLFKKFEKTLGPVGTSKCFHLLAPKFFPLWDGAIAKEYVGMGGKGNAERYWKFMAIARDCFKTAVGPCG